MLAGVGMNVRRECYTEVQRRCWRRGATYLFIRNRILRQAEVSNQPPNSVRRSSPPTQKTQVADPY